MDQILFVYINFFKIVLLFMHSLIHSTILQTKKPNKKRLSIFNKSRLMYLLTYLLTYIPTYLVKNGISKPNNELWSYIMINDMCKPDD
jgi:hypothetical protein